MCGPSSGPIIDLDSNQNLDFQNQKMAVRNFLALLVCSFAVCAQPSSFQCIVDTAVPPLIRAEGTAELAGDVRLVCTGGTPTPVGQAIPQLNITLIFSTNVTSKLVAGNQFSEALLMVDDPASWWNPARPMLNCGNSGAADNGSLGPGICGLVSSGNPNFSYDGTPN